jgi:NAD(P)-dependent dehydrogenase (short-subunit alcohol dehydrogenase family)
MLERKAGLEGKVAVVTGAGGKHGIGRAIALKLSGMGASLAVTDVERKREDIPLDEVESGWRGIMDVKKEIMGYGNLCMAGFCDITKEEDIIKLIDSVLKEYGHIDILVNNARAVTGQDSMPLVELDSSVWDRVIAVNLRGTYLCCKYAGRQMIEQKTGGRIINISSEAGKRGVANMAAYCASKFGIIGLTQSLALDLAPYQITVNAICPGSTDTHRVNYRERLLAEKQGIPEDELREQRLQERARKIPLGRAAVPDDIAAVAAFLASEEAGYITGQSINVSGGSTMH